MIAQAELNKDEKESWDRFVVETGGSFLQSWEWGEFQKSVGRKTFYLKGDGWQTLVVKHVLPLRKSYLYCPRGPVILSGTKDLSRMRDFLNEITKLAKKEKAIFVRVEPTGDIEEDDLRKLGFIKAQKDVQPKKTLILDLNLNEDELLGRMHEKTRYNIGLAQRKGVSVRKAEYNEKDFEEFWNLLNQTVQRQKIAIFEKEYYRKQLQNSSDKFKNLIFIAQYQGKIIAANLVNVFGNTMTYTHGGSDNQYRALMAPHLLQWEQIREAKNRACKAYDFWGIDEINWPGITRFKKGFGGQEVQYIGTFDLILKQAWYSAYILAKRAL